MKSNTYLTSYTDLNLKWTKDSYLRVKTVKLLEENIEGKLYDLGFDKGVLDMTPKV